MTRTERRAEMLAHVAAWKASGLSRKSYCSAHGLGIHTLNYWCAKARHEKVSGGFVPLDVSTGDGLELCYPNGVRLLLPSGTSMAQVAAYVRLY
ncbi:MAG: IS66 family insertion sequence element accessory protein TnpB [Bacteroidetes bacterium]|nr:IS66 family insertion sequence element accessory protein TnpB [Bacteroidota bacterium]